MRFPARITLSFIFVCAITTLSESATIQRFSFVELSREADLVVQASVEAGSKRVEIRDQVPWTCLTLRVTKNLKGGSGPSVELCFLGGVVGTRASSVVGQQLPSEGKEGFFFISDSKKNYINPLIGWSQGIFYITTDSTGRQIITTATGAIISTINLAAVQTDDVAPEAARGVVTAPQAAGATQPLTPSLFIDVLHKALMAPQ